MAHEDDDDGANATTSSILAATQRSLLRIEHRQGEFGAKIEGVTNTVGGIADNIRDSNRDASDQRRRLYDAMERLAQSTATEFTTVRREFADMRTKVREIELMGIENHNMIQMHVVDIPMIKQAVTDVKTAHALTKSAVDELVLARSNLNTAVAVSKIWWGMLVAGAVAVSGVVSATVTAVWHYYSTSGRVPGK